MIIEDYTMLLKANVTVKSFTFLRFCAVIANVFTDYRQVRVLTDNIKL